MNATIIRLTVAFVLAGWIWAAPAASQSKLRSFCRVKGQEENTLTAIGIVTGLQGTGDGGSFMPATRALAMMAQRSGSPIGPGGISELKDAKNVAIVTVRATVPAAGSREGNKIDCVVTSWGSAKSLSGGYLHLTSMVGPIPDINSPVYAIASGPITLEDKEIATVGRVHKGCQMVEDFFNPYVDDGKVTLVLNESFAGFTMIQELVRLINESELLDPSGAGSSSGLIRPGSASQDAVYQGGIARGSRISMVPAARALDQLNIEIEVPIQYLSDPVLFMSEIMDIDVPDPRTKASVLIRERSGSIVCSADVEIGPVVIKHRNLVTVEAGNTLIGGGFVPVSTADPQHPKLRALITALESVKVPNEDIIEIIKSIEANGNLYAELVIE
jgi:flagellar P-ring protein precursor FlgI